MGLFPKVPWKLFLSEQGSAAAGLDPIGVQHPLSGALIEFLPRAKVQLFLDMIDVVVDRLRTATEDVRNIGHALALAEQLEHL